VKNFVLRIVAVLLIPCLLLDPVTASPLLKRSLAPLPRSQKTAFDQQALTLTLAGAAFVGVAIYSKPFVQVFQMLQTPAVPSIRHASSAEGILMMSLVMALLAAAFSAPSPKSIYDGLPPFGESDQRKKEISRLRAIFNLDILKEYAGKERSVDRLGMLVPLQQELVKRTEDELRLQFEIYYQQVPNRYKPKGLEPGDTLERWLSVESDHYIRQTIGDLLHIIENYEFMLNLGRINADQIDKVKEELDEAWIQAAYVLEVLERWEKRDTLPFEARPAQEAPLADSAEEIQPPATGSGLNIVSMITWLMLVHGAAMFGSDSNVLAASFLMPWIPSRSAQRNIWNARRFRQAA
jgi:hypothetical protein